MLRELQGFKDVIAFDTETTGLSIATLQWVGFSVYDGEKSIYIPFNFSTEIKGKKQTLPFKINKFYELNKVLPDLRAFFKGKKLITHNGKFDLKVLKKYGLADEVEIIDDTQIMAYLLGYRPQEQALKHLAERYNLIDKAVKFDEVSKDMNWFKVDFKEFARYGELDAIYTWKLAEILKKEMQKLTDKSKYPVDLMKVYTGVEIPLIPMVSDMEFSGMYVDLTYLKKLGKKIEKALQKEEQKIYDFCKLKFNIGSSKQLGEVLFDRMKLPIIKKTAKGSRSTDIGTLNELRFKGFKIAENLIRYSELKKLLSTYAKALPEKIDKDKRLRANFNQTFTVSGRFSSSSPNMQNIPTNGEFNIRRAFRAKPGYVLLGGDYSQLELRVMAGISQDPTLVQAYKNGGDIHQKTTDGINNSVGLHLKRKQGKQINFSVLYGMGGKTLATNLNNNLKLDLMAGKISNLEYKKHLLTEAQGNKITKGFFKSYPEYAKLVEFVAKTTKVRGYSTTLFGRKRDIPEIKTNFNQGKRYAVSQIIQGTAADIVKKAMWQLYKALKEAKIDFAPLLQVHDEVWLEVRKGQEKEALKIMQDIMENVIDLGAPLVFEPDIFDNWGELKTGKKKKKDDLLLEIGLI